MKNHLSAALSLSIIVIFALACNNISFSTANISELKFGTNEKADPSSTTFETGEDVYAVASVSNVPDGKYSLTWRITYENVKGREKGEEIGTNTREFEGSARLWQTFSSPLPGEYKVEASLKDEKGKEVDNKSGLVTIK